MNARVQVLIRFYSWSITIGWIFFWRKGGNCYLLVLEMYYIIIIIMYEYDDDAFEKDALKNLYPRMNFFLFVEIMKTGHEVATLHGSLSNKKSNSFQN